MEGWAPVVPLPRPDHVVMVIEQNKSFAQIIGNTLADRGALFTSTAARSLRKPLPAVIAGSGFYGPMVTPGRYDTPISHDGVLRTLADMNGFALPDRRHRRIPFRRYGILKRKDSVN